LADRLDRANIEQLAELVTTSLKLNNRIIIDFAFQSDEDKREKESDEYVIGGLPLRRLLRRLEYYDGKGWLDGIEYKVEVEGKVIRRGH